MNVKQKPNNIVKLTIFIALFIMLVLGGTYAVMINMSYNTENVIASIGSRPVFTSSATNDIVMNEIPYIAEVSQTEYEIANGTDNILISLSTGYTTNTICTYDIVWEWSIESDQYVKTNGATKEFTVSGVSTDGQTFNEVQLNDYNASNLKTLLTTRAISASGSSMTSTTWTFTTHFYKTQAIQSGHAGNAYSGKIYIDNVNCTKKPKQLAEYISYMLPKSGTDAVSNSPWILTEDHPNEWRYAGKNPDNYLYFNGELWRIIGVMPNMTYCTGTYGTETECNTTKTGSLVKIIRNQAISSSNFSWDYKKTGVGSSTTTSGSNDWSDSQLMLMLNGTNYLKSGYDVNGNKLHQSYTITSNVVAGNGYNYYNATYSYLDGTGTTVYVPSSATTSSYTATSGTLYKKIESSALNQIATVKWDLYGTNSYNNSSIPSLGSPIDFYNKERNINDLGAVYTGTTPENRPVYWYGKIGLMYPSDYGYATNGGSTYNRDACLDYRMVGWNNGDYKTDCATNSYLLFQNITSTAPGTSGAYQWATTPYSGNAYGVFYVASSGSVYYTNAYSAYAVRPVLYLKAETEFGGGTGIYNDPYTLEPKQYWFATGATYTYPNNGGTVQSNGLATGHGAYIGQDTNKYYSCLTTQGHEICLSQPYTKYGLEDHVLNDDFSSEEQNSLQDALENIFNSAGVTVSCLNSDDNVYCWNSDDGYLCGVKSNGLVYCNADHDYAYAYSDGTAKCKID